MRCIELARIPQKDKLFLLFLTQLFIQSLAKTHSCGDQRFSERTLLPPAAHISIQTWQDKGQSISIAPSVFLGGKYARED